MDNAKTLFVIGIAISWSLAAWATPVDDPGCLESFRKNKGDDIATCQKTMNVSIKVTCLGDHCPNINVYCQSERTSSFINCNYSQILNLLDIFHTMNVNDMDELCIDNVQSPPSRQYFRNFSVPKLTFKKSNFTDLPFDMLYDVLFLRNLRIHETNLVGIPDHFFSNWSRQLSSVDIMYTKLQKIRKNDFAHLVNLEELLLYGNEIKEIETGAFDDLSNLGVLDLGYNHLRTLPVGIFRYLSRLERLNLNQNPFDDLPADLFTGMNNCNLSEFRMSFSSGSLRTLPDGFFKSLGHLKKVQLQGSQLESLPADLFDKTSTLVELNLRNNSLETLPTDFFDSSIALKNLTLAKNHIVSLPLGIFKKLVVLNMLDISYNNLTNLSSDFFKGLWTLEKFNASHNNLIKVDHDLCDDETTMRSIRVIDFSFNRLTFQPTSTYLFPNVSIFHRCKFLTEIYLSNNKATQVFYDFNRTKYIDLSNNAISELTAADISDLTSDGTLDLRNNQISKIDLMELQSVVDNYLAPGNKLSHRNLKILLGNNPVHCDCHLIDFVRYWKSEENSQLRQYVELTANDVGDEKITCASPSKFEKTSISSLSPEELSCPLKTDTPCDYFEYPGKNVLTANCSRRNLSQLPPVLSVGQNWSIELNMSHNMLQKTPSLSEPYLMNVTSLDLSDNNISIVTIDVFTENLVELRLHNNSISRLDERVSKYLKHNKALRVITLHDNPWQCDCEARSFLEFIQAKTPIYRLDKVACYGTNRKLYKMTVGDVCRDAIAVIVGASLLVALFGIIIGILAALYYKYQQQIKIWLYAKQWCIWLVTEDELDKDKKYDAFVSFSHKDEDFVEKEIVAKLEDGPRPFKLCLHYRDWLAGEWIPVQISQSVEESRRTIVVLSANFLESVWGRMEFRTAHTQALKEGRARVIIILYGDIENMDDLDPELKAYLSLNTYIKWGDPWFWDKLRYALPHRFEPSKRRTRNARIIEEHLARQSANNDTGNACIAKSDVISMSKLANDSEKLLDPAALEDRMPVSC